MVHKFQITFLLLCAFLSFSTIKAKPITYNTQYKIAQQCIKETGIEPHVIHQALKTDMNPPELYKAYLVCNYKLHGFFDANGQIVPDVIASFLSDHYTKEEARYALKECSNIQRDTVKDTVFETAKCFLEKDKEVNQARQNLV